MLQTVLGYTQSSKQKIPFIVYQGEEMADSHFCIQHLNRVRGVDLSSWLTDEQRAVARAFQMMAEDHLFWWATATYACCTQERDSQKIVMNKVQWQW